MALIRTLQLMREMEFTVAPADLKIPTQTIHKVVNTKTISVHFRKTAKANRIRFLLMLRTTDPTITKTQKTITTAIQGMPAGEAIPKR